MKRTKDFLLVSLLLLITTFCRAQMVGGEQRGASQQQAGGVWKNRVYLFIAGLDIPTGKWAHPISSSSTLADVYLQHTGAGAGRGYSFQFGKIYYLKKIAPLLDDKLKIGINATWIDFSFMSKWTSKWSTLYKNSTRFYGNSFLFFAPKIGVMASYNIAEKIYADAHINIAPTLSNAGTVGGRTNNGTDYELSASGSGLRKSIGIIIRAYTCSFGLECVFGKIKYNVHSYAKDSSGNVLFNDWFDARFKTGTFRLKFGFTF